MTTALLPERSLLCLLGVALALVAAGCQRGSVLVPDGPVLLEEMRADDRPYFWVGGSFDISSWRSSAAIFAVRVVRGRARRRCDKTVYTFVCTLC
jgi:hypothetical protein